MPSWRLRQGLPWLLLAGLALWPLWSSTQLLGAGPDVVSTLWGMWWAQASGLGALTGLESTLVNHPNGAMGSVLSPTSALLWGGLEPLIGVAWAYMLTCWVQLYGSMLAVAWLSKVNGASSAGAIVSALALLVSRYFFFGIGEGSIVAVLCLTVVLGLGCLQRLNQTGGLWWALGLWACVVLTALENPYLTPILPLLLLGSWVVKVGRRTVLMLVGVGALIGLWWVAQIFAASASPDYPREVAGQTVVLLSRSWEIVDLPWARLSPLDLLNPRSVVWTTTADNATAASGGLYFGFTVLGCALLSIWSQRLWGWGAMMLVLIVLSMGSVWSGLAMPFLALNSVMDAIARPLTQPTRYLAVALVVAAVCVGTMVSKWTQRNRQLLMVAMLMEAILCGGLSLDIPRTVLPALDCAVPEGGVIVWPHDAVDGEQGRSQLLQLAHGRPSPQTGIASWRQQGERVSGQLRGAGLREDSGGLNRIRINSLGYQSLLVDKSSAAEEGLDELVQDLAPGAVAVDCGDVLLVPLVAAGR